MNYARLLRLGILLGVAGAALWAAGRRYGAIAPPRLIDWDLVRSTATRVSRRAPFYELQSFEDRLRLYTILVQRSQELVADYVGERLPQPLGSIHVFDRGEWIDANINNFKTLFEPLEELYARLSDSRTVGTHTLGTINRLAISSQLGMLLGYLSQRVLGQYDLSIFGREPVTSGRLYFVEPNIIHVEKQLGLNPYEFRQWIALHETTHAFEFEAHPWVSDYMNQLLSNYFRTVAEDMLQTRSGVQALASIVGRVGSNLLRSKYILELLMSPEQQQIFRKLQAMMSLLEGYSNHVMQEIGKQMLPSYETLKEKFEGRLRHRTPAEQLFAKLTGLDIKLEQYRLGEHFANTVVGSRGIAFLNRVWRSPDALPALHELENPKEWVYRIELSTDGRVEI